MSQPQFGTRAPIRTITRSCGDCTLCCKVLRVVDLAKPAGTWCQHCDAGKGCRIYEDRPESCRAFSCLYLQESSLGEEWRPKDSKLVLQRAEGEGRMMVHVDPQRPDAWKQEPFHSALRTWARNGVSYLFQVLVVVGPRIHIVLPDRDVDLGVLASDKVIQLSRKPGGAPHELEVRVVDGNDASVPVSERPVAFR